MHKFFPSLYNKKGDIKFDFQENQFLLLLVATTVYALLCINLSFQSYPFAKILGLFAGLYGSLGASEGTSTTGQKCYVAPLYPSDLVDTLRASLHQNKSASVQVYLPYISITLITQAISVCKDHVVKKITNKNGETLIHKMWIKKRVFLPLLYWSGKI